MASVAMNPRNNADDFRIGLRTASWISAPSTPHKSSEAMSAGTVAHPWRSVKSKYA